MNCHIEKVGRRVNGSIPVRDTNRAGMTLWEVLVAIGIMAMLIAILVPAIQVARASARRMQCASQLRQLTLGLHNYSDQFNCLPMFLGRLVDGGHVNFVSSMFPQLGVGNDVSVPRRISLLMCPSDELTDSTDAPLSYVINGGPNMRSPHLWSGVVASALTLDQLCIQFANVTDGLSGTGCFSERIGTYEILQVREVSPPQRYTWTVSVSVPVTDALAWTNQAADHCEHGPRNMQVQNHVAMHDWFWSGGSTQSLYGHHMNPNAPHCDTLPAAGFLTLWGGSPTSLHGTGVNLSMLDGSVRFVSQSVDRNVWRAMGTRDGAESVEGGQP